MTREETKKHFQSWCQEYIGNNASDEDYQMFNNIMALLEQEPYEDCISRKAIRSLIGRRISWLEERMSSETNEGRWVEEEKCHCAIESLEFIDEYIKALPPVAPKSKTGWMDLGDGEYKCPKCHKEFINGLDIENMTKFFPKCPNCGARMEERHEVN